jgi:heme A synthase
MNDGELEELEGSWWQRNRSVAIGYLIWFILAIVLGGWLVISANQFLIALGFWLQRNGWEVRAMDMFSMVTLGLLWLAMIFWLDHYLIQGARKKLLRKRASWVLGIELGLLALFYLLHASLGANG